MKNNCVVICQDIIEFPVVQNKQYLIMGKKFGMLEDVYSNHFPSSRYNIHIASKVETILGEWNVNGIRGKMYAFPYKYDGTKCTLPLITEPQNKWIVSPLFHTLY